MVRKSRFHDLISRIRQERYVRTEVTACQIGELRCATSLEHSWATMCHCTANCQSVIVDSKTIPFVTRRQREAISVENKTVASGISQHVFPSPWRDCAFSFRKLIHLEAKDTVYSKETEHVLADVGHGVVLDFGDDGQDFGRSRPLAVLCCNMMRPCKLNCDSWTDKVLWITVNHNPGASCASRQSPSSRDCYPRDYSSA